MNEHLSLQEATPNNACWGCGPANAEGLRIRSFPKATRSWRNGNRSRNIEAFPGVLNGGIIGTLLDCHCNWTAAWHLMKQAGDDHPPCTVTADYAIKLLRPTPTNGPVLLSAKVVDSSADRATIEGTLSGGGKVCATCRGTFVAVKEGHPAFHRWYGDLSPQCAEGPLCPDRVAAQRRLPHLQNSLPEFRRCADRSNRALGFGHENIQLPSSSFTERGGGRGTPRGRGWRVGSRRHQRDFA